MSESAKPSEAAKQILKDLVKRLWPEEEWLIETIDEGNTASISQGWLIKLLEALAEKASTEFVLVSAEAE